MIGQTPNFVLPFEPFSIAACPPDKIATRDVSVASFQGCVLLSREPT
ncbi:protein of unknown function (plasmid) [Caballeronia sp. S22]